MSEIKPNQTKSSQNIGCCILAVYLILILVIVVTILAVTSKTETTLKTTATRTHGTTTSTPTTTTTTTTKVMSLSSTTIPNSTANSTSTETEVANDYLPDFECNATNPCPNGYCCSTTYVIQNESICISLSLGDIYCSTTTEETTAATTTEVTIATTTKVITDDVLPDVECNATNPCPNGYCCSTNVNNEANCISLALGDTYCAKTTEVTPTTTATTTTTTAMTTILTKNCTSVNPCGLDEGHCEDHYECKDGLLCGKISCRDSYGFNVDCCSNASNGDAKFCTKTKPCDIDEGDCNFHNECIEGLVCGFNTNCPDYLGFNSTNINCCYNATLGDEEFCTVDNPCGINEGDCDVDSECQLGLGCGSNNCPASVVVGLSNNHPEKVVDCCSACCQNINVTHSNDYVKTIYENLYGTYSVDGTDNHQRQYYLQDDNGYYGIWWCNENENWITGLATNMGTCGSWFASADKSNTCPDSFGYDWKWYDYVNGAVLTSAGKGLKLVCATTTTAITTSPETSTKATEELDCSVVQLDYVGDDYCDDISNTENCGWDGGDCCGNNLNYDYCDVCECLDPNPKNIHYIP